MHGLYVRFETRTIPRVSFALALLFALCSSSLATASTRDGAAADNAAAGTTAPEAGASMSGATAGTGVSLRVEAQQQPLFNTSQLRAVWVDAFNPGIKSPREVERLLQDVHAAHANVIFVQVRKRGDAYYNRGVEPRANDLRSVPEDYDPLAYLIQKAHSAVPPIEVHAWLNVTPVARIDEPPASTLHVFAVHGAGATGDDNWLSKNASGGLVSDGLYFLDPGHPQAAQYTSDLVVDLIRNYDLDGIHLDFIRYAGVQWGYNDVSVSRFNARYGTTGAPAVKDPRWLQWRRDQVTNLVRQIYLESLAVKPQVKISAALITWGRGPKNDDDWRNMSAYNDVLQDWPAWLQEGILDLGVPMNYDDDRNPKQQQWFNQWVEYEKDHAHGRQLAIGLGVFMNDAAATQSQFQRSLAPSGAGRSVQGVSLYSYAFPSVAATQTDRESGKLAAVLALLDDEAPAREALPAFTDWARTPDMPWKTNPVSGYLKGNVRLPDGQAADGYDVDISGALNRTLTTAGTGFYGALDLPPGEYTIDVARDGNVIASSVTVVTAGRVSTQDFDLPPQP